MKSSAQSSGAIVYKRNQLLALYKQVLPHGARPEIPKRYRGDTGVAGLE